MTPNQINELTDILNELTDYAIDLDGEQEEFIAGIRIRLDDLIAANNK